MRVKTVGFGGSCFSFPRNTSLLQNSKMFAFPITVSAVNFGFLLLHNLPSVIGTENNAEAVPGSPHDTVAHAPFCFVTLLTLTLLKSFLFLLSMSVIRCEWTRNTVRAQKSLECVKKTAEIHLSLV